MASVARSFRVVLSATLFFLTLAPAAAARPQSGPPGDTCATAIPATTGINPADATGATFDPTFCGFGYANLWFSFVPAATGSYAFTLPAAGGAILDGVYEGPCGAPAMTACASGGYTLTLALTAGSTYYVEVGDWLGDTVFDLTIAAVAPAPNDECAGASPIYAGFTAGITNATGVTTSPGTPCGQIGNDLWFAFTATCDGTHSFRTCNLSNDDTVLALYASCGSAPLVCDDDNCGGQSRVDYFLAAGVTYYLRLGGYASNVFTTGIEIYNPFQLSLPTAPGTVSLCFTGGTPFAPYFAPFTTTAGLFPYGGFFGLDISYPELLALINFGPPFLGVLDGNGAAFAGPYAVPPGLTFYAVGVDAIDSPAYAATAPVATTTF